MSQIWEGEEQILYSLIGYCKNFAFYPEQEGRKALEAVSRGVVLRRLQEMRAETVRSVGIPLQ